MIQHGEVASRFLRYSMNLLQASATAIFLFVASWVCANPVAEKAAEVMDPKAIADVLEGADTADPLLLMRVSLGLLEAGQRDKAVFWFYAGQLRARYWPKLQGENGQILMIYLMTIGEQVNAAAFRDIPALVRTLDQVVAWDERTFARWAAAMKLDPEDRALLERRRKAVEGLEPYKKHLLAQRESLEKYAREYRSPGLHALTYQERIDREYSREPVDLNVAGTRFRVPANYLAPTRLKVDPARQHNVRGFWVFLPDFDGYTKENWRAPNANPDAVLIRISAATTPSPATQIEGFLAEGSAEKELVRGIEAAVYDAERTHAPLPVTSTSRHYVIKAPRARGGAYYVVCDAPLPHRTIEPGQRCEMFLDDVTRQLRISARFRRDHLAQLSEIEARLSNLIESWIAR